MAESELISTTINVYKQTRDWIARAVKLLYKQKKYYVRREGNIALITHVIKMCNETIESDDHTNNEKKQAQELLEEIRRESGIDVK